jgi:hypothetical protein
MRLHLAGDVGVQTEDGFHRLIRRGARLPARAGVTLRTAEHGQTVLQFSVLQRLGPAWNALFRHARIEELPERPRGKVKIRLDIEVDGEGRLAARVRVPGRKGASEVATGQAEVATKEGLERAVRETDAVGLLERGLLPPGTTETPDGPLEHRCEACSRSFRFHAVSLVSPPLEGFTCDSCCNLLLIPSLDNMLASFFRDVPGGRLGLITPAASVEPDRAEAHERALDRLEDALRPCPCGGAFRALSPARCPHCGAGFVDYAGSVAFRARQTHLPLVEGSEAVPRGGSAKWTDEHLAPYLEDFRPGSPGRRGDLLLLPLSFRNRDGWLVLPIGYGLVIRFADGRELRAFRPADMSDRPPRSPEEWQQRQSEEDAAFAAEVVAATGIEPLLGRVEPDATVEGTAVFPLGGSEPEGPLTLLLAQTLEARLS